MFTVKKCEDRGAAQAAELCKLLGATDITNKNYSNKKQITRSL